MSDCYIDIDYKGRIKSTHTMEELEKKIQNFIKRNKLSKLWECQLENDVITINFNDGISDEFVIEVNKYKFEGSCRVYYDQAKEGTTLEKLLDLIFSAKSIFTRIEVDDDYSICKSYLDGKKIKIKLLELNEQQLNIVKELYDKGYEDYRELIFQFFAESLGLKSYMDIYVNDNIGELKYLDDEWVIIYVFESWLFETCMYKGKRFYENGFYDVDNEVEYQALGGVGFDTVAFSSGIIDLLFDRYEYSKPFGVRDANVKKFYRMVVADLLRSQTDKFEQCVVAFKYVLSILDYTNFSYAGKFDERKNDKRYTEFKCNGCTFSIIDVFKRNMNL